MKFFTLLAIVLSSAYTTWGSLSDATIHVIPKPMKMERGSRIFVLNEKTQISADQSLQEKAEQLAMALRPATGYELPIRTERSDNAITLKLDPSIPLGKEGYKLSSTDVGVTISAATPNGLFYGIQTLRQLLPAPIFSRTLVQEVEWTVPAIRIEDRPRFDWRGLMVDSSRTFWSVEYMKKIIDRLALYKMNVMHMHLVDDQGWRLEIKTYPELTTKGAYFPAQYHEPAERQGFYTQDDIRELVAYAAARNVTLVPEIEMPGHCIAMLNAMPALSCSGKPHPIHPFAKGPNIHPDILCAGNEKTFEVLGHILDEVYLLFPSPYIHVGGDEAPKTRWKKCPKCQQKMKAEGLQDEDQLQSYFIARMEKHINQNGRKLIGWDEIIEGGLAPNAAVMSWRGTHGGKKAAQMGHAVVMTPTSHCYFDYSPVELNTERVYSYEPIPAGITKEQEKYILGAQANFWSHIDRTEAKFDQQIFPRLAALAEVCWTPKALKNWPEFSTRLQTHIPRQHLLGINVFPDPLNAPVDQ